MAKKSTTLLEKFKKKVDKVKKIHEFEWDGLKPNCPHRKRRKRSDEWTFICELVTLSNNNTNKYVYYCHFSNCPYT